MEILYSPKLDKYESVTLFALAALLATSFLLF